MAQLHVSKPTTAQARDESVEQIIEGLMRQYASSILRLCLLILQDYHLAEDAMQDTFLKAYRSYDRFRGDSSVYTWLTRIAVNTCKDIRRSAWHRRVNRSIRLEDLPEPSVPPQEADDTLIKSVLALPVKLRETVLLVYYSNLSAAETAKALSIGIPTVYRRLEKARGMLKVELEGWFHGE